MRMFVQAGILVPGAYGFWQSRRQGAVIDRFGPDGVGLGGGAGCCRSREERATKSGYVYYYAYALIIGIVAFVAWYALRGKALG